MIKKYHGRSNALLMYNDMMFMRRAYMEGPCLEFSLNKLFRE